MSEFWLLSVPKDKTCSQIWERTNAILTQQSLGESFQLSIPNFKVGTLDQLIVLSDDLVKLENCIDLITRKIAKYYGDITEGEREHLTVGDNSLESYVTKFLWDGAKYPIKFTIQGISDIISKQVNKIEADLKSKSSCYDDIRKRLDCIEKNHSGSLLTKNLADIVKKEDFITGSQYLTTLVVVVPHAEVHAWENKYETLTEMVVPRSSKLIATDVEYFLFTVSLFQKSVEDFKLKANEHNFTVRDFEYRDEELTAEKREMSDAANDKKKQFQTIFRWLKANFSESFCALVHVKVLRLFVESVLRYGLPANFQVILMHPESRNANKLRHMLNQLYEHLDQGLNEEYGDFQRYPTDLTFDQTEYYPYVSFKININMFQENKHHYSL